MVVLTKKIISPHDLIPDTNILHSSDKSLIVNKEFTDFWDKHSKELELLLKLPYVVFGEIQFQHTTSARKSLTQANDSIKKLSRITTKQYSHQISEKRITKEVENRIRSWVKILKGDILPSPLEDIDWGRLIDDSIWRNPPFSFDPKKEDLEKGFRDSIILETLCDYSNKNESRHIIFVTNDNLLREAAETRLKGNKFVKIMSSLDDVGSYFKLMQENFTEAFVDSIIDKASMKFIDHKNKNSIVFKEGLAKILVELAGDVMSNPSTINDNDSFDPDEEWTPLNKGQFSRIGKSQFISIENGHSFFWREEVHFSRKFNVDSWDGESRVANLTIIFHVNWKANVSENERFTQVKYIGSELEDHKLSYEDS
jgi:hypothetical protein